MEEEHESEDEGESDPDMPLPDQAPEVAPAPATTRVHMKTTQPDRRDPVANRGEGTSRDQSERPTGCNSSQPTPAPSTGSEDHPDAMTNLVRAVGRVSNEHDFLKMITQEMCKRLGRVPLAELIPAYERGPTPAKMEEMAKRMSLLTMENSRLRKTIELKDEELSRSRIRLHNAHQDIQLVSEICRVPADTVKKAELYATGITESEVFRGDTFKKFVVASMKFTKRIEDSNKQVVTILERLEAREAEASTARAINLEYVLTGTPRAGPGQVTPPSRTPVDAKGKAPVGETSAPVAQPAGTPTGRTRSAVRQLDAEGWAQSPAGQKLHEQEGVAESDKEEAVSTEPNAESGSDGEEPDVAIVGVKRRGERISATPLKKLREIGFDRVTGK